MRSIVPRRRRSWSRPLVALAALLSPLAAQERPDRATARPIVQVVPITGTIDMGLAPFVDRMLAQAKSDGAVLVVLDINTFGGRVDAAVSIRDALLSSDVRTVAFINRRAISAGALISLAAHTIVMTDGGTIGAATPVQIGPGGEAAKQPPAIEEKSISYVRKEFRSTADARGRPPLIAEAMVDADVEIPGLVAQGKLLTLTTDEALTTNVADLRANSIAALLDSLGYADADIRTASPNWGEEFVRLITNPILASLLLSIGMLGILLEIRTPGFGVPGALGVVSLALVLGGHWTVALVGWEELLFIGIGVVLLLVEVLVVPGFGIPGLLGIAAITGGLALGMVGSGFTMTAVAGALTNIALAILVALVASLVLMRYMGRLPFGRRLTLDTELEAEEGFASTPERDHTWLGRTGRTTSPLRPAGFADIDGERIDVVSDGEMIEAGVPVIVSRVDGNRIVVRREHPTLGAT
jgi:membrane-bound serine protease (ClpP class)